MPGLTHQEHLQPSLLDRLTDQEPDKRQDLVHQTAWTGEQMRESIRRDLTWLFNATRLAAVRGDVDRWVYVKESVLNYGMPDMAGRTLNSIDVPALEAMLREMIWRYEPRLLRDSVKVTVAVQEEAMNHNAMSFLIEADVWGQPLPLRMVLRTDVDLESGSVEVFELNSRGVA